MCFCERVYLFFLCSLVLNSSFSSEFRDHSSSGLNRIIAHSDIFQRPIYKGKQLQLIKSIKNGTRLGLEQCQQQFQWERWNCPESDFLRQFWKNTSTREQAYQAAIMAAGIAYSVTKDCTNDQISDCGKCNKSYKMFSSKDKCLQDTSFSHRLTTKLLGGFYKNKDYVSMANVHNHKVGISAVKKALKSSCKCHGVSGSCPNKTCWNYLPPFQEIASLLKKNYLKAMRLQYNSVKRIEWKKIPRNKMVYLADSPDYCRINNSTGWMGTVGRTCSHTDVKDDRNLNNCYELCLSCGYTIQNRSKHLNWQCNCQFHWCCNVTCDSCSKIVTEYYCS